jgi:hypothetical protein
MALTSRSKRTLEVGIADKQAAAEISAAIDASSELTPAATVAAIAVPASADAEDVAIKLNDILVALKAAGLMDT